MSILLCSFFIPYFFNKCTKVLGRKARDTQSGWDRLSAPIIQAKWPLSWLGARAAGRWGILIHLNQGRGLHQSESNNGNNLFFYWQRRCHRTELILQRKTFEELSHKTCVAWEVAKNTYSQICRCIVNDRFGYPVLCFVILCNTLYLEWFGTWCNLVVQIQVHDINN